MNRHSTSIAMSFALLGLISCQWVGGTTNEPPKGSVDRRYSKSPDEVARAASEALNDLQIPVQSDQHDALGGQIKAQRSNASEDTVIVWYQSADARTTQVSVGVAKGDRQIAQLIQDEIAQKLGAASARSAPAVGARVEGEYDPPVAACLAAAEAALKDLKVAVSRKDVHDTWAQLEARQIDSLPIVIRMTRTEKDKTLVTFTAGSSKSQDTEQIAERVKVEFERTLSSAR
ncbi:MAG TPA: DUF3568 family protein [Planctomycetota bacterium]|nr:DUF3568 family protein [Planctomycetota bacterium]